MIEPDAPTTIWIKQPTYPAFLLASDEGRSLKPSSIILRHRHLDQQQRTIQSGASSGEIPSGRLAHRTVADIEVTNMQRSGSPGPSTPGASTVHSAPRLQSLSLSIADDASQAVSSVSGAVSATQAYVGEKESLSPSQANTTDPTLSVSARSQTVETSIGPLLVTFQERALRARGNKPHIRREKTTWYLSSSNRFLDTPPALPDVSLGELYVHEGPDKQRQVWVWSKKSSWTSLQIAAPHPYLSDYILNFCSNGEPSWVTKETLRTYIGRIRKREAQSESRSPSTAPPTE